MFAGSFGATVSAQGREALPPVHQGAQYVSPEAVMPLLYQKMPWHAGMPSVIMRRPRLAALKNGWHN